MEKFFHSFASMAFHKNHVINIYIIAYIQQTQITSENTGCLQQGKLERDGGDYIPFYASLILYFMNI